jgi:hypothetical protein
MRTHDADQVFIADACYTFVSGSPVYEAFIRAQLNGPATPTR